MVMAEAQPVDDCRTRNSLVKYKYLILCMVSHYGPAQTPNCSNIWKERGTEINIVQFGGRGRLLPI